MSAAGRTTRARALRATSTDAEHRLWSILRGRLLDGAKFRRQFPIDRYFADFACPALRLIVEVDGSQHIAGKAYDDARSARLRESGWSVIRFWSNEVLTNTEGVAAAILSEIEIARARNPSRGGEKEGPAPKAWEDEG